MKVCYIILEIDTNMKPDITTLAVTEVCPFFTKNAITIFDLIFIHKAAAAYDCSSNDLPVFASSHHTARTLVQGFRNPHSPLSPLLSHIYEGNSEFAALTRFELFQTYKI